MSHEYCRNHGYTFCTCDEPDETTKEAIMSKELKPCPFCGSGKVSVSVGRKGSSKRSYVECEICEGMGGMWETEANAIAAWNTRQPEQGLVKALKRIKDLQDLYYEALASKYCPDIRHEATEALARYKGDK